MHCAKNGWNRPSGSGDVWISSYLVFSLFPNYFPLENGWGSSFELTWNPFTQGCSMPSLVRIKLKWIWWRFKFHHCIFHYFVIIPLGKRRSPSFEQTSKMLEPSRDEISSVVLKKFLKSVNVLFLFHIYIPLNRAGSFIWTNLSPLYLGMLCAKIG